MPRSDSKMIRIIAVVLIFLFFHIRSYSLLEQIDLSSCHEVSSRQDHLWSADHTLSGTLGFDEIFVISLPDRKDRRSKMARLARNLNLNFTLFDATPKNSHMIRKIWTEARKFSGMEASVAAKTDENWFRTTYGDRTQLQNLAKDVSIDVTNRDPGVAGTDLWWMSTDAIKEGPLIEIPKIRLVPTGKPSKAKKPSKNGMPFSLGNIAVGHSVSAVMRQIVRKGHTNALLLEDDVDFEVGTESYLSELMPSLPANWDTLFLGYCWTNETKYPPLDKRKFSPNLRKSAAPLCLHAWAVSARGARKLLEFTRYPGLAYMANVDEIVRHLVVMNVLESYSITPSLVIQTRDNPSDLMIGSNGTRWRERLQHSALEQSNG